MKTYRFHTSSKSADLEEVSRMVNGSNEVEPEELLRNCSTGIIEQHLGYSISNPIKDDPNVRYYVASFEGKHCYYIYRAGVRYIFTRREPVE